jgi:hypothetical protein
MTRRSGGMLSTVFLLVLQGESFHQSDESPQLIVHHCIGFSRTVQFLLPDLFIHKNKTDDIDFLFQKLFHSADNPQNENPPSNKRTSILRNSNRGDIPSLSRNKQVSVHSLPEVLLRVWGRVRLGTLCSVVSEVEGTQPPVYLMTLGILVAREWFFGGGELWSWRAGFFVRSCH